jgi:tetratricopeptide (TPR) repeat protein
LTALMALMGQVRRRSVLALPLLPGCATTLAAPQTRALLAAPPTDLPRRHHLSAVPFVAQTPYHCGPAALAMVLQHVGLAATPQGLADAVFLPSRQGALQDDMLAASRRSGALAFVLEPQLQNLCREVANGQPVVVLQNLGLSMAPRWHYAVAVGFDLSAQQITLHSGVNANEAMALPLFERTWARGQHWALVCLLPGRLPHTVSAEQAVAAAVAFERVGKPTQNAMAHQAVLQRWPNNLPAALGLGNAQAAQGDWLAAASTFEAAVALHNRAALWHNLGVARLRMGQREAAARAAAQALQRAQTDEPQWLERARVLLAATT